MHFGNNLLLLAVLISINLGLLVGIILSVVVQDCHHHWHIASGAKTRIFGGQSVKIKNYPFMAAIVIKKHGVLREDSLQCGGCIISRVWLLTAAHCVELMSPYPPDKVVINTGNAMWRKGRSHYVLSKICHENYDKNLMANDIGLIRVKQPFCGKWTKPILLASRKFYYRPNTKAVVLGWGLVADDAEEVENNLRGVKVVLYNDTYCNKLYPYEIDESMVCAGYPGGGKDACQFDSGGPLFQRSVLIGLVSWGKECAKINQPGVYTRVGKYQDWIVQTTKKDNSPIVTYFKNTV